MPGVSAQETRSDLQHLLRDLPPSVAAVLRHDPSLLVRADYLAPYPALAVFLQQHPEVPLNPGYFIGTPQSDDLEPAARAMRLSEDVLEGLGAVTFVGAFIGFLVWLVRTALDHRRWLRQTKTQVEVHTKVLDRLSSHDDLVAYIQSPSGRRFLDAAAIDVSGPAQPTTAALTRVMWALQAGVVLVAVGLGFWGLSSSLPAEALQGFAIIRTLCLALGGGFIVSAGLSYAIATRHGLIGAEVRAQHE